MQLRGWAVSLVVVTVLFAGCASKEPAKTASSPAEVAAPGDVDPEAGSILVSVLDEAGLPVAGAQVGILTLELVGTTDDAGAFRFTNLAEGEYEVEVQKIGFQGQRLPAVVTAQEETQVTFKLVQVEILEPYSRVFGPVSGEFQCRWATGTEYTGRGTGNCGFVCPAVTCVDPALPFTNTNTILEFNLTSPQVASVIGEMRWSPSAYATSTALRLAFSYTGRSGSHWWCAAEGPSPLQFRWDYLDEKAKPADRCTGSGIKVGTSTAEPVPTTNLTLRIYTNTPFTDTDPSDPDPFYLTLSQKFEMGVTVFYVDPAPKDPYSIFA